MNKIKIYTRKLIIWIKVFWERIWSNLRRKKTADVIDKETNKILEKQCNENNEDISKEHKREYGLNYYGFRTDVKFNKLTEMNKYEYEEITKNKKKSLNNCLYTDGFSGWEKIEKNLGIVEMCSNTNIPNKNNALKLSVPGNSMNSMALLEQKIKLKPNSYYIFLITVKTDKSTTFPLLYINIDDELYKLLCNQKYRSFKITFMNNKKQEIKLNVNTGYKISKAPTNFYIENIMLYEKQFFTVDDQSISE